MNNTVSSKYPSSRPHQILMTSDTVGGVWNYSLDLIHHLAEYGINVSLATMGAALKREQVKEAASLSNLQVFESTFKLEWMEDPWNEVERAGNWLLGLEERLKPDLIHLNGFCHGSLDWQTPVMVAGHSCVLSWWEAVKGCCAPDCWRTYQEKVRDGLQSADLVVAPSNALMEKLEHFYGPFNFAEVIPNGADPRKFQPDLKEDYILTVGRLWDEAKNVGIVEQISSELSWPVYVAGEEKRPNGSPFQSRNLRLLGGLSSRQLSTWYAGASIYALPARYEPFGLSVLEAGLSGCALVLGDIDSLREIWDDAAIFVKPEDPEMLKAALEKLIAEPAIRSRLAARAHARAFQFTSSRMAECYVNAYRNLSLIAHRSGVFRESESFEALGVQE